MLFQVEVSASHHTTVVRMVAKITSIFNCVDTSGYFISAIFYCHREKQKLLYRRCTIINKKRTEINEEIRDREVRLIDENGDQLGVVPIAKAMELAEERERDLVKIAPGAKPPVCKIMDYGKHKYEQAKREKEARKKQQTQQVKEIRLSLNIEEHDIQTKAKNAAKFLSKGDKLKVSLRFRGRQLGHTSLGFAVFDRFAEEIKEFGTIEKRPKMEGRSMTAMFLPNK